MDESRSASAGRSRPAWATSSRPADDDDRAMAHAAVLLDSAGALVEVVVQTCGPAVLRAVVDDQAIATTDPATARSVGLALVEGAGILTLARGASDDEDYE